MSVPGQPFLASYPADLSEWEVDDRLSARGFVHGWRSHVGAGNGEAFFDALVHGHLRRDAVVLDVGCGHGSYACELAAHCRRVIGLDGDPKVVDLARELAGERGVRNVEFRQVRLAAGPDETGIPGRSVDVFACRRGPVLAKWLGLALRVARPGAVAVGVHPTGGAGAVPSWNSDLPEPLRIDQVCGYDEVRGWLTDGLDQAPPGVRLDGCWWLDVPETFDDPEQLHAKLAGSGDAVPYADVKEVLTRLFAAHGGSLVLRHCRLVWQIAFPG